MLSVNNILMQNRVQWLLLCCEPNSYFTSQVSETSLKNIDLSEIEARGVKLVVRYGLQLKCLESNTDGIEDLTHLLKHTKFFLQGQQKSTDSSLRILVLLPVISDRK